MIRNKLLIVTLLVTLFSVITRGQTHVSIPYFEGWEGSTFPAWTITSSDPGEALLGLTTTGGPNSGNVHLVMSVNNDNNINTNEAWMHLDLTGDTAVNLEFWWKDIGDDDNATDGIYFSDNAGASFQKVYDLVPESFSDDVYRQVVLNLDSLAADAGLTLNDQFVVKFQQTDDDNLTGGSSDGFYFDDIFTYRRSGSLSPGGIMVSAGDSICSGISTSIVIDELFPVTGGAGTVYTYFWQSSEDLLNWSNFGGTSPNPDTTFNASLTTTTYYRRGITTDAGEGPSYSSPIAIHVDQGSLVTVFTADTQICANNVVDIFGFPQDANGTFTGSPDITDNGDGTATFSPSGSGMTTIYYTYTNASGCDATDSVIFNISSLPIVSFTGLPSSTFTTSSASQLSGVPSGGVFLGSGISDTAFYPQIAGEGSHDISYTYTDPVTGCSDTTGDETINVINGLSESIVGLATSYCIDNNDTIALVGVPKSGWATVGFVAYPNMTPIISQSGNNAEFVPSRANVNTPYEVYFKFSQVQPQLCGLSLCLVTVYDSVLATTFVHSLPVLNVPGLASKYCQNDAPISLEGIYSTSTSFIDTTTTGFTNNDAGAFSGVDNNILTPANASPGVLTVTYSITDANSCSNSVQRFVQIDTVPVVQLVAQDSTLCGDAPFDTLVGTPAPSAGFTAFFNGVSLFNTGAPLNNTVYFNPNNVITDSIYPIRYTFIDGNGCRNSDTVDILVNSLPIPSFVGLNDDVICGDEAAITLTGNFATGVFSTGNLADDSAKGLIDNGDGTALLDPSFALQDSTHSLTFYYFDPVTGCDNDTTKFVTYSSLPILTFVNGLDSIYCVEDPKVSLKTSTNQNNGNTWFNGVGASKIDFTTGEFVPSSADTGLHIVEFEQINKDGCQAFVYDTTLVISMPEVGFTVSGFCNNDTVRFTDTTYTNIHDTITSWVWNYGNGISGDSVQNGATWYINGNRYDITLSVNTVQGCAKSYTLQDTIGSPPIMDFVWDNICFGDTIQFADSSSKAENDTTLDPMVSWHWDFGDGQTSTLRNPLHTYAILGSYNVQLTIATNKNCIDSLTRVLNIRPVISSYPYFEDFENGDGNWVPGIVPESFADTSTWIMGIQDAPYFSDVATGNHSYYTSADTNVAGEHSYVDGVCFDLSSLQRPMIVFDIKTNMSAGVDGANLQYSIDNAVTWQNLGELETGINWYDHEAIGGQPGGELKGWSLESDSSWREARHSLDSVAGLTDVKFRFAFSTSPNSVSLGEGFAFDNIWIGERTRMVLYEHFTNSSSSASTLSDDVVDNVVSNNPLDVVDVQYHISSALGPDPMYEDNSADASARNLYYGILEPSLGVMDGNQYQALSAQWNEKIMTRRSLADAEFDIAILADINGEQSVNVTPTITSRFDQPERNLTVHIMVVEKEITELTGLNGDNSFRSVMKQMLPDATGTKFIKSWNQDESTSFTEGWTYNQSFYGDQSQMRVIVCIQDNDTKEILQTNFTESFVNSTGVSSNLEDKLVFGWFPNPAQQNATLLFGEPVKTNDLLVEVYSLQGQRVHVENILKGANKIPINVGNWSNGLYVVRVRNTSGNNLGQKQIVVSH